MNQAHTIIAMALLTSTLSGVPAASAGDGCGSENSQASPRVVKTVFPGASKTFENACNTHDACYGTRGMPKSGCDNQFVDDMHRACSTIGRQGRQAAVQNTAQCIVQHKDTVGGCVAKGAAQAGFATVREIGCRENAAVFGQAVKRAGQSAYNNAPK